VLLGITWAGPSAHAVTGSGDSATGGLETVRPTLTGITVPTSSSIEAVFSEPMRPAGLTTPGNYVVSGAGAGTLGANPGSASGAGPVTLTWSSGEMLGGATLGLTVTGVQDALGNPIDTALNTANGAGVGVAPVFSGLSVTPGAAAAGETVTITFASSEDLLGDPDVTVNGNPASPSAKAAFSYDYTVLPGDAIGPVEVEISGFDLAGNVGTLNAPGALEVVVPAAGLPLRAWPVAVALLAAGVLALALRRKASALLVLALLAAPVAMAATPTVTNVAFVQQATPTGTEVVITYDLVSPNGPSDITVSLSKDGGVDGFAFPVSSVTGDLSGVTSGTGKSITWDIGADYPNENIPNAQLRVTADDGFLIPPHEMIAVAAGSFEMGRTSAGDDATYGQGDELPAHTVTLSAYQIGKFEVTNQQVCDVFNWADDQGYFTTVNATTAQAFGQTLLNLGSSDCHIEYVGGVFQPETRTGLPGATVYSMAEHPVQTFSWYGAVAFCNWLSEIEGLDPVYDTSTWEADFSNDGYHLPTEAQWERAAAWDGSKHWIYSFTSDTLTGKNRANYAESAPNNVNPLGLTALPYTSPVGWFDGVNMSPNGSVATVESVSPIGAYDMSGNVWEWCHDRYNSGYYATGAAAGPDPKGPATGLSRVVRGASWDVLPRFCRSADRGSTSPAGMDYSVGFRLARTTAFTLSYAAGPGGSLSGDTDQAVLPGEDSTPVTAVPNSGFVFVDWSDGVTDNPRTDTNVASGIGVTANFQVQLVEMISVPAGSFDMGHTSSGDDATYGQADELPVHTVTLSAYQIGKYEVTNQQYCDVLNWAIDPSRNYLRTSANEVWTGTGTIYAGDDLQPIISILNSNSNIQFSAGSFSPKTRVGLPGATNYSTGTHPVQRVSWYGSVSFANWLSEMEGLTPVYDAGTAGWPANFANNGYHLPTEAQWERAAAWDGTKHWVYSFTSDTLTGKDRANYYDSSPNYVNPLGLTTTPYTSPVGWFDGMNVSPNGSVMTVDSVSPVGAYDMTGNVWEWCHDWYAANYYNTSPETDPRGDASGSSCVIRGGSWESIASPCRSAERGSGQPASWSNVIGFRLARTLEYSLSYAAGPGGSLSGDTDQAVLPGEDGTPVTAVADSGYFFVDWSDGVTDNPRTDTNVASGIGVTANFQMQLVEMISVPAGSFDMGNPNLGGGSDEYPVHTVTLSAYEIGKFEVTNQQVCDVFNYADDQGYFTTVDATTAQAFGQTLLNLGSPNCHIEYVGGVFQPETRTGDPGGSTVYSMADHPVQTISWYGAVAFCNWLSEMKGLAPVYDTSTWEADFSNNGYHLPTEAQWERAAAWDGTKHWVYGFTSDTLTGKNRANYYDNAPNYLNPLGLTAFPYTSPVGWFDGVNVSPNGSVATVDSVSPVGAYDMSGSVWEWCHDWYLNTYYSTSPGTDPPGAASGTYRIVRGGSFGHTPYYCRSAHRSGDTPGSAFNNLGFRLAR